MPNTTRPPTPGAPTAAPSVPTAAPSAPTAAADAPEAPRTATAAPDIRLLALDIDGTLTAGNNVYSAATIAAVHAARAAGIEVLLATSRRYRTTRIAIDALRIDAHAVCLGGALTKDAAQKTIASRAIPPATAAAAITLARTHQLAMICQLDNRPGANRDFIIDAVVDWGPDTQHYFALGAAHGQRGDALAALPTTPPITLGIYGTEAALARYEAALHTAIASAALDPIVTHLVPAHITANAYLEIIAAQVSKWTGVAALAAHFAIEVRQICAIGDARNDLPLLTNAGLRIAMANAPDDVRERCDWVTGSAADDGVATAIAHLLALR